MNNDGIMKKRFFILILVILFPLVVAAQASGGQIRRSSPKPKTEVRKPSKPRNTTGKTEQRAPIDTSPAIQPIPMADLAKYNVVVGTFGILANAQGLCQSLRDRGFKVEIYYSSSANMYRVVRIGTNNVSESISFRDEMQQKYPGAWILIIDNGRELKYE